MGGHYKGASDRVSPGSDGQIYVFSIPYDVINTFQQKIFMLLTSAFEPPIRGVTGGVRQGFPPLLLVRFVFSILIAS